MHPGFCGAPLPGAVLGDVSAYLFHTSRSLLRPDPVSGAPVVMISATVLTKAGVTCPFSR